MGQFDLASYSEVKDRIVEYVQEFPKGAIQTFLRYNVGPEVIFEARVYRTEQDVVNGVYTTGWAREIEGKSPVNKTSHVENCETSAIGRALANMAYGTSSNRSSRSEMLKVNRMNEEHDSFLAFVKANFELLTEEHTIVVGDETLPLRKYIIDNGANLKEQYGSARATVNAMEKALGVAYA